MVDPLPIRFQPIDKARFEIRGGTDLDSGICWLAFLDPGDQLLFPAFHEVFRHVQVGSDVDRASGKHVAHDARRITEASQRFFERMKTAVEPFHQQRTHDCGKLHGDAVGALVFLLLFRFQEADRSIPVIRKPIAIRAGKQQHGAVIQRFECRRERIENFSRGLDSRENDALVCQVLLVVLVLHEVIACPADRDFRNYLRADEFVDLLDLTPCFRGVGVAMRLLIGLLAACEEVL
ncbi:hypothetical protein SDC9_137255 [bioreactor metagenome]|uniref:Uncharacterized protein n=1 Tax=bioreactor metagenome TaxID=1076179 RepID=A0A645DM33_9ZZZZ